MPRRRTPLPQPLPPRDGVPAARVRMPVDGPWSSVVEFLLQRTGDPAGLQRRMAAGEVLLDDGSPVEAGTAYRPGQRVHLHRDVPDEPVVPGDLRVLYQDENLVVVDKPHFLATMPRGRHVRQSAVLLLRARLELPEIAPAHRLDRLTAGVLVLTTRAPVRAAYQELFARREVHKTYLALAPIRQDLQLPVTVRSRIVKERGSIQAQEVPGEPNAITEVELVETVAPGWGLYRLSPVTGKTHQLRVHVAGLGIPISNDPLYPQVRETATEDFSAPLRLVASRLAFTDPISGTHHQFTSHHHP